MGNNPEIRTPAPLPSSFADLVSQKPILRSILETDPTCKSFTVANMELVLINLLYSRNWQLYPAAQSKIDAINLIIKNSKYLKDNSSGRGRAMGQLSQLVMSLRGLAGITNDELIPYAPNTSGRPHLTLK